MAVSDVAALAIGTESAFSTVPGSSHSSYTRVPAEDGIKFDPAYDFFRPETQGVTPGLRSPGVLGGKGWGLGFKVPLHGLATAGANSVEAVNRAWMKKLLLACAMAEAPVTGTTVSGSSSTTTSINVTDASGFEVGFPVMIAGEVRRITAIDTGPNPDNITISPALSGAPAAGVVVYAPALYYFDDSSPGTASFVVKKDGYAYTATGGKGSFKLSANAKGRPMLEFSFKGDAWTRTEPTGTIDTLTTVPSLVAVGSPLLRGTSATAVPWADFAFDPGIEITEQLSGAGTHGRAGFNATKGNPTGSFKPYLTTQMQTDFAALTMSALILQIGAAAGAAFALVADKTEIGAYPAEVPVGGIDGFDLKFNVLEPTTAELPPFLLAFF